jgi:hypothetical protein
MAEDHREMELAGDNGELNLDNPLLDSVDHYADILWYRPRSTSPPHFFEASSIAHAPDPGQAPNLLAGGSIVASHDAASHSWDRPTEQSTCWTQTGGDGDEEARLGPRTLAATSISDGYLSQLRAAMAGSATSGHTGAAPGAGEGSRAFTVSTPPPLEAVDPPCDLAFVGSGLGSAGQIPRQPPHVNPTATTATTATVGVDAGASGSLDSAMPDIGASPAPAAPTPQRGSKRPRLSPGGNQQPQRPKQTRTKESRTCVRCKMNHSKVRDAACPPPYPLPSPPLPARPST